jgi:hypothetical protein
MDPITERKLARIKNYSTRYEYIMTNGSVTYLVMYGPESGRQIRQGLDERLDTINKITGQDNIRMSKPTKGKAGDWEFKLSGRTQRECILEGEHIFIGDVN